jgi:protein-arginine kinase activator protein McsA
LDKLQEALKRAIREERYEEAARLRDQLKKMQSGN